MLFVAVAVVSAAWPMTMLLVAAAVAPFTTFPLASWSALPKTKEKSPPAEEKAPTADANLPLAPEANPAESEPTPSDVAPAPNAMLDAPLLAELLPMDIVLTAVAWLLLPKANATAPPPTTVVKSARPWLLLPIEVDWAPAALAPLPADKAKGPKAVA
jgi:hypothetical protein